MPNQALRYGQCLTRGSHSFTCHPHTNHTCLYSPAETAIWLVLIAPTHKGMARRSWPGWMVTNRNKRPAPGIETGHPSQYCTNRDRRKLTSLLKTTALPLRQITTVFRTIVLPFTEVAWEEENICFNDNNKNKKLRCREEHNASVFLSWCTFLRRKSVDG